MSPIESRSGLADNSSHSDSNANSFPISFMDAHAPKIGERKNEELNAPVSSPQDEARSRLLAEFIADVPHGRRRIDVNAVTLDANIAAGDDKKNEKPTPEQEAKTEADKFKKTACDALTEQHKNLNFTKVPGGKPTEIEPNDSYQPKSFQTPAQISIEKLGTGASQKLLDLFTSKILALNGLAADQADKALGTSGKMRLPGLSADGAVVCRDISKSSKYWQDGSKLEESIYGTGTATYKDQFGFNVTVKWDPENAKGTSELRETANTKSLRAANGDISEQTRHVEKTKDDKGKESEKVTWESSREIIHDDEHKRRIAKLYVVDETPKADPKGDAKKDDKAAEKKDRKAPELKTIIVEDDKSKINVSRIGDTKEFVGTKRNTDGELLDDNYHLNLVGDKNMVFFSRKQLAGGGTEDRFEDDKGIERRTKDGKLSYEKFTDEWGRSVEKEYGDPPQSLADKILVHTKDNKTIEFKQGDFGDYWGSTKFKPEDGPEFQARVHRLGDGLILYNKGNTQSWSELKDGTKIHKCKIMSDFKDANLSSDLKEKLLGGQRVVQSKDGETLTQYFDKSGTRAKDIYEPKKSDDNPISKIVRTFQADGKTFSGITTTQKSGEEIKLEFDRKTGMFRDVDTKATSERLSKAYYFKNKLILTGDNSAEHREIQAPIRLSDPLGAKQSEGKYDHQLGIILTPQKDGGVKTETVSPGREDLIKDGKISGKTIAGERSTVDPGQETVVYNRDGSKLQFKPAENRISYWGPTGEPTGSDLLSAQEQKYYKEHAEVQKDPRDFAEMHRAFVGRENELKSVYTALDGFETAVKQAVNDKKLTEQEASALRKDILHDIAHPEEMDQEQMGTCNVEVVRREMAMNTPARYISTFANAVNGKVAIADTADLASGAYSNAKPIGELSQSIPVDLKILKMADSTGRNLAARIFDNLAIEATLHPAREWRPTPDGVGVSSPADKSKGDDDSFSGMEMGQIATCLTRLTGVKRTVVNVDSVKQLSDTLDANGGRSLIITVDAGSGPITATRNVSGSGTDHVITLVKIDEKNDKAWFMNNWGLESDHSTASQPASAKDLLDNMVTSSNVKETSHKQERTVEWTTPGQCIGPGEPGKVYCVKDGKLEEDPRYTIDEDGMETVK